MGPTTRGLHQSCPCFVKGISERLSLLLRRMVLLFLATLIRPRLLTFSKVFPDFFFLFDYLYLCSFSFIPGFMNACFNVVDISFLFMLLLLLFLLVFFLGVYICNCVVCTP